MCIRTNEGLATSPLALIELLLKLLELDVLVLPFWDLGRHETQVEAL